MPFRPSGFEITLFRYHDRHEPAFGELLHVFDHHDLETEEDDTCLDHKPAPGRVFRRVRHKARFAHHGAELVEVIVVRQKRHQVFLSGINLHGEVQPVFFAFMFGFGVFYLAGA